MTAPDCSKTLVIYGAGGLGREVLDVVLARADGYADLLFADDGLAPETIVAGHRVLGGFDALSDLRRETTSVVIAVGKPPIRARIWRRVREAGFAPATVVDPTAVVRPSATIKPGCVVGAHAFVSCGAVVGENVVINAGAVVSHDVEIGPHSIVQPLATVLGGARVGEAAEIGAAASVMIGRRVADHATIAMGAVAFANVRPDVTVVGNPARTMFPS